MDGLLPTTLIRRAPWGIRLAVLVTVVACLSTACAKADDPPPPPISVSVRHGSQRRTLRVPPGTTIGVVLRRAHVAPVGGRLLSAGKHKALRSNGARPTIRLGGRPATTSTHLTERSRIDVIDGRDTTEGSTSSNEVLEPSGLPKALQYVQYGGRAGLARVTRGAVSHEVLDVDVIHAAIPVHRATGKVVALTFDDGPDPRYTPKILEILKAKHVPAAFCEIGKIAKQHPELTAAVVKAHRQLCNHTFDHVEGLEKQPLDVVRAQIEGGRKALTAVAGQAPVYYRPPGGSLGPSVYQVAAENHEPILYWSIDTRDWTRPDTAELVAYITARLVPGSIILLHDGGGNRENTVQALPSIIDYVRALGYTFTLPITTVHQVG
jgi:peptidoglycan/xylan/chitin deacetylase (PgdA/CDA1 family)